VSERLLREFAPQVLAAVARRHGRFDLAEDATQEALIAAAQQWPVEGVPVNPRGWLIAVATRRLIDALRADAPRTRREEGRVGPGATARRRRSRRGRHADGAVPVLSPGALAVDTDWSQVLKLYDLLHALAPSPVVMLNRAVGVAMVAGPGAGLASLDALDGDRRLASQHRLASVRGHLHEMAGDVQAAVGRVRGCRPPYHERPRAVLPPCPGRTAKR
jgi:predicted RNA polymerase sigma factor